jgi:hypothetical protein
MRNDKKLLIGAAVLLMLPISLAFFGHDQFRYPCQDSANWDKDFCKMPICDVTRTCPEHIFKGQRDPRLGPPKDGVPPSIAATTPTPITPATGANCK